MRCVIASACSRRRRPCSAPAVPDASLEAVAKRAGVGIGTLYRHFPTREALFEAVYRREVEQLSELAEQLKRRRRRSMPCAAGCAPNVEFVATKKGMSAALALAVQGSSELYAYSFDRLTKAIGTAARSRGRGRRDTRPISVPKTFCARSSACATCTTSPAGRAPSFGYWMSLLMVFVCKPALPSRRHRFRNARPPR